MTQSRTPVELPEALLPHHALYRIERYDVRQAAAYLCIGRSEVYRLAKSCRIAHGKRSQKLFFAQADLDAYRDAQRVEVREMASPRGSHVVKLRRAPAPRPTLPVITHRRFA